jgi:hypothetical protein
MGIITTALVAGGMLKTYDVPYWVILCCHLAMGGGTMAGGWRIIKTMGQHITKLTPFGGFSAEAAGALTLMGTAHFGIPVSTTHTITCAIVGVGASRRLSLRRDCLRPNQKVLLRKSLRLALCQIESAEGGTSKTQTSVRGGAREMVEVCSTGLLQLSCSPRESGQPSEFSVTGDPALATRAPATQPERSDDLATTCGYCRVLAP